MKILQIVPRLKPAIDGIGDYAFSLAIELEKKFKISTDFLVADPFWDGSENINGFKIAKINKKNIDEMINTISDFSTILLHYVGYGYSKRGCPIWLIQVLKKIKELNPNFKLVTMFHELYATGPIWSSAFWLLPIQKNITANLVQLSNCCVTNINSSSKRLIKMSSRKHNKIHSLPVFSNVGELEGIKPLKSRERILVIFGNSHNRNNVYKHNMKFLKDICDFLKINKIYDIGPKIIPSIALDLKTPIIKIENKDSNEISNLFRKSFAGMISYNPFVLSKSSIFAAYCSHGLLPINSEETITCVDGLVAGKHYFTSKNIVDYKEIDKLQKIATNAYQWYQYHNLTVHAKLFATLITE